MTAPVSSVPSATAAMTAAYRARASERSSPLCDDPWARPLAGELGAKLTEEFDRLFPSMELLIAVRTRVFDAQLLHWTTRSDTAAAVVLTGDRHRVRPIHQVVVIGAGMDSRAARLGRPGVTFYEVDHPRSMQYKQERIRQLQDYPAGAATAVACDLEHDDLVGALSAAGFQPAHPALVLCEGLVPYLSEAAVRRMFSGIALRCHADSIVVLDHVAGTETDPAAASAQEQLIRDRLERIGEPLRFGKGDALALLHETGLRYAHSLSLADAHASLTGEREAAAGLRFQQVTAAGGRPV